MICLRWQELWLVWTYGTLELNVLLSNSASRGQAWAGLRWLGCSSGLWEKRKMAFQLGSSPLISSTRQRPLLRWRLDTSVSSTLLKNLIWSLQTQWQLSGSSVAGVRTTQGFSKSNVSTFPNWVPTKTQFFLAGSDEAPNLPGVTDTLFKQKSIWLNTQPSCYSGVCSHSFTKNTPCLVVRILLYMPFESSKKNVVETKQTVWDM